MPNINLDSKGRRTLADFCRPTKDLHLSASRAVSSDKCATKSGLVGRSLTVLDPKTSSRALSASVRWTKTICRGSRVPQPMRNCHESHVNKPLFKHGGDRLGSKTKRG